MAEKEKREVVVMRINKTLKERLDKLSDKRKTTLTSLTNEALKRFLDSEEYIFEDVLEVIKTIPSLAVSLEKIKREMDGCPSQVCKQMIDTMKDKRVFLYEETLESLVEKIDKIEKQNMFGIFVHITAKSQEEDFNKVNSTLQKITEILKDKKINLGAGLKSNDHHKVLLFVSYNKKGEDDKK